MRFDIPLLYIGTLLSMTIAAAPAFAQTGDSTWKYARPGEEDMILSSEHSPDSAETRVVLKRDDRRERVLPPSYTGYGSGLLFPSGGGFERHAFYMSPDSVRKDVPQQAPAKTAPPAPSGAANPHYSYDSREWVEYRSNPAETGPFDTESVAMLFERASAGRLTARPPERAAIEIKPSYAKHLKYSRTCGVVLVLANFPTAEIESILSEIATLQTDLTRYMGVPPAKETIELCLFRDEKSYQAFLKDVFPKAPRDRRALYIKLDNQPGTLLVQRTEDFEIDLRHEMTHAIIHASIPFVPIWLDEGLAKYFEVPPDDRSEKNPYMKPVRRNTRFGAVPSLKRLERLEHIGQMGTREYRDSWAWAHFLVHYSPDTHRLLAGYLQLLSTMPKETSESGYRDIPALSSYLEDIMENSRDNYREHFRTWGNGD